MEKKERARHRNRSRPIQARGQMALSLSTATPYWKLWGCDHCGVFDLDHICDCRSAHASSVPLSWITYHE